MARITARPADRRRRAWTLLGCGALAVAVAGIALAARWPGVGVWVLFGGAVAAHIAGRRASDCAVLAALAGVPLSQVAMVPARVSARSDTPIADLARIRAAGSGLLVGGDVARVIAASRLDGLDVDHLLSGQWERIAVPAPELDGEVAVDRLGRLPHEGETWIVSTPLGSLVLNGEVLRAAASSVRRTERAGRAGDGRGAVRPDRQASPSGARR
jgi:hypothetical protein